MEVPVSKNVLLHYCWLMEKSGQLCKLISSVRYGLMLEMWLFLFQELLARSFTLGGLTQNAIPLFSPCGVQPNAQSLGGWEADTDASS